MAADVTLLAIPDTAWNRDVMQFRLWQKLFDDDEVCVASPSEPHGFRWMSGVDYRPEFGEIEAMSKGDQREVFDQAFYDRIDQEYDHHEIGPWSTLKAGLYNDYERWIPGPTHAVFRIWGRGAVVTPGMIGKTMVAYNLPDRSHYRDWGRNTNLYGHHRTSKLGSNRGKRAMFPGERRWPSRRKPAPRLVRRWLVSHLGDLVWAESW